MTKETFGKVGKKLLKYWLPVTVWMSVIFFTSSHRTIKASGIHWTDFIIKKTYHMLEYGFLTMLLYRGFKNSWMLKVNKAVAYSVIISFFYGISDEIHQSFTPGREPTVRDALIDLIGSLIVGYLIIYVLPKIKTRMNISKVTKRLEI